MRDSFWLAMGAHVAVTAVGQSLMKLMTRSLPRAKALAMIYSLLAATMISINGLGGWQSFSSTASAVLLIGVLVSFGAQSQWRAYAYSMSRTSLLLPLAPIWGSILAAVFLAEPWRNDPLQLAGIVLMHAAAFSVAWRRRVQGEVANVRWLLFTLSAVVIFGVAMFLAKACSAAKVPVSHFLMYWYTGGMAGSLLVALLEKEAAPLWQRCVWQVPLAGACILTGTATLYWAFSTAPAGLVLAIKSFCEATSGMLVGWYIFCEVRQLSAWRLCGFCLGLTGLAVIVLSWLYAA